MITFLGNRKRNRERKRGPLVGTSFRRMTITCKRVMSVLL